MKKEPIGERLLRKETFYCQQELFGMKGMIYEEYVEECKEIEQRIYKETD